LYEIISNLIFVKREIKIHANAPLDQITEFVDHQFLIKIQNKKMNVAGSKIIKSRILNSKVGLDNNFKIESNILNKSSEDNVESVSKEIFEKKENKTSTSTTTTNSRGITYYLPTFIGLIIVYIISKFYGLGNF